MDYFLCKFKVNHSPIIEWSRRSSIRIFHDRVLSLSCRHTLLIFRWVYISRVNRRTAESIQCQDLPLWLYRHRLTWSNGHHSHTIRGSETQHQPIAQVCLTIGILHRSKLFQPQPTRQTSRDVLRHLGLPVQGFVSKNPFMGICTVSFSDGLWPMDASGRTIKDSDLHKLYLSLWHGRQRETGPSC